MPGLRRANRGAHRGPHRAGGHRPTARSIRHAWAGALRLKASPVAAELSWAEVNAFRLGRHHLLARAPKKELTRVVGDIGGAQAQLMSAAELQIGVRADCAVQDVRDALWKHKSLVKTWLMRGTLHLIPAEDLPVYAAAMSTRWTRINKSWLKLIHLSEQDLLKLVAEIGEQLDGTPRTREEIVKAVGKGHSARVLDVLRSGWGGMLKPAARQGLLCFGPSRGQSVTFVRPEKWLGSWRKVDPDAALIEVARRYLRAFGPAGKLDFARWWGNWPGVGTAAWTGLESELVPVSIEGTRAEMLAADLDSLAKTQSSGASVQLLPLFDPYLMGHANRDHLYAAIYRSRVSRTSGWISAVVLVDGRVAGTWFHTATKETLRIKVEPFQRLAPKILVEVKRRAESLAETLGLARAEVSIA